MCFSVFGFHNLDWLASMSDILQRKDKAINTLSG